jgi:hypothetical protein
MDQLYFEFVWLATFEHTAKGVLTEDDRRELEDQLLNDPERGAIMEGTGGFRKMRIALEGRGKSGGARVIYFYSEWRGRIYMALVYPKSERVSLTAAQKQELRRLARILKGGT